MDPCRSKLARMAFGQGSRFHVMDTLFLEAPVEFIKITCIVFFFVLHLLLKSSQQCLQLADSASHDLILVNRFNESIPELVDLMIWGKICMTIFILGLLDSAPFSQHSIFCAPESICHLI